MYYLFSQLLSVPSSLAMTNKALSAILIICGQKVFHKVPLLHFFS